VQSSALQNKKSPQGFATAHSVPHGIRHWAVQTNQSTINLGFSNNRCTG
jgi:hypothetical protein